MTTTEHERIQALLAYDIMDTPSEADYDEIVKLASWICGKPISLISLLDSNRQWFKARVGLNVSDTPIEYAFCAHAINGDDVMVVNDATKDDRFKDNPLVTSDPDIRFYAGMPLITPSGTKLGTLCVIDNKPGDLSAEQIDALRVLAKQVINNLETRKKVRELKEALNDLEVQRKRMATLDRFKSRLLSIVGHDVRNPLATLNSIIELASEDGIPPDELQELRHLMRKQINAGIELLNNLVDWGIQNHDGTPHRKEFELTGLLQDVLAGASVMADQKGLQLVLDTLKPIQMNGDMRMLQFVIRNLVQNAIKYTEDGTIRVGYIDRPSSVDIYVHDTGAGMTPEQVLHLFDWSNRKSTVGTRGESGSGLGLIMCKEFVDAHGGDILIDSKPGTGTMFTVRIPR
jgi:signal transduction histidine kinase